MLQGKIDEGGGSAERGGATASARGLGPHRVGHPALRRSRRRGDHRLERPGQAGQRQREHGGAAPVHPYRRGLLPGQALAVAAASLGLSADQVTSYLLKREELGSTGIGQGIAIPHARLPELKRPYGLLAKLKQGIEFDAIDGKAVDVLFVLLLPAAVENDALAALALVARTLRSPDTLARLRAAKNPAELHAAMA